MIDIDDSGALPELRQFIVSVGLDASELTDDEVRARVRALLEERVPAPAVGFGDGPATALTESHRAPNAGPPRPPGTNRCCRLPNPPATDLLPIRRPLLPLRYQEAGESPQTQAKRPTPIPRVFGGFRPCLLDFAKH
jgi:hypothetical protein